MRRPPPALARFWRLLRPYRWQVAGLTVLLAASAGLAQLGPQFVRYVFDTVIPSGEVRLFLLTGAVMLAYYLVTEALAFASMYFSFAFTQTVIRDVRAQAYRHLLSLPLERIARERTGSLASRVVSDVNALESMIQGGASRIVGQLFSILVVLGILFAMSWRLALISLVIVAVMGFFTLYYQAELRRLARSVRARVGDLLAVATEAVANIGVVKLFNSERTEFGRFDADSRAYRDLNMERRMVAGKMEAGIGLTSNLGVGALVLVGGWLIVRGESGAGPAGLSVGMLTAFLLYLNNLINPVRFVLNFNNMLQAGMAALERIDDLLHVEPERGGGLQRVPSGDIRFDDVTFTYPGAGVPAANGLTFGVRAGQTVALVGPSGAGKTTVTALLGRLYDPDSGGISIGGVPLREFDLAHLRRGIAVVPQDPTLFSGTLRDNIRYARPEATDAEVREAAELANAMGFIDQLPQGFDTEVGERGVRLSGGQKQRIAIARALLKGASILVLDEATSSLDSESEAVIQDALSGLFAEQRGLTSIVIAHRLSTIRDADLILVMDAGRVVEQGRHAELLASAGLYRHLHDLQAGEPALR